MKILKLSSLFLLLFLALSGTAFAIWASNIPQPMPEAQAALVSDATVSVDASRWLVFQPTQQAPKTGLIFYPGGRVPAGAYAPFARDLAAQGYLVVIVPMPLNLAVFGYAEAQDVIQAFPEIRQWALGGHSLGGAMAARFAYLNPTSVSGLALLAAYPSESDDLSQSGLRVLSIYGDRDGLLENGNLESTRHLLPADSRWWIIQGGNHAQFGWYGAQQGDREALIPREEQQEQTLSALVELLNQIEQP